LVGKRARAGQLRDSGGSDGLSQTASEQRWLRALPPELVLAPVALVCGAALVWLGSGTLGWIFLALVAALVLIMRRDELMAALLIVISLLIDWYQLLYLPVYLPVVATIAGIVLIGVIFLLQSPEAPWIPIPHLRLWGIVLVLAIIPMFQGSSLLGGARYYATVLFTPFVMYVVGVQVARDGHRMRRLLQLLALFATLVAVHSIIQARTGIFLLANPVWANYLASVADFQLGVGSQAIRAGSFFANPDSDGTFMAIMTFIPLGLCLHASLWRTRLMMIGEAALILLGLFYTYSTAAWMALGAGLVVFMWLALRGRQRLYFVGLVAIVAGGVLAVFPSHIRVFLTHASAIQEYQLRLGIWETALRVIAAHPITGIGLGLSANGYQQIAERYRVALQAVPVRHPHNAYLELAALAGLPVLAAYLAVLGSAFAQALRAYRKIDVRQRPLLGGAIAAIVVLSVNSLANQGWTLAPLAAIAWLIVGALVSPALAQALATRGPADEGASSGAQVAEPTTLPRGGTRA
jgi:O-antigen ligase